MRTNPARAIVLLAGLVAAAAMPVLAGAARWDEAPATTARSVEEFVAALEVAILAGVASQIIPVAIPATAAEEAPASLRPRAGP